MRVFYKVTYMKLSPFHLLLCKPGADLLRHKPCRSIRADRSRSRNPRHTTLRHSSLLTVLWTSMASERPSTNRLRYEGAVFALPCSRRYCRLASWDFSDAGCHIKDKRLGMLADKHSNITS
ncbi:hypothetical protein AcV5_007256 [Taiwanofungus camphoratus]|nr:hypothetical protein AcV5_007256 [Antrodia cinnamomea]KAI0958480.1 hypothetical protein AcV7_004292 [Antrodia cinnamomea]